MRNNYLFSETALVDADNNFSVKGFNFKINGNDENYRVVNKYDEVENYSNESIMTHITAVLGKDMRFYFYDENGKEVKQVSLK